jgi:hypothetical protein
LFGYGEYGKKLRTSISTDSLSGLSGDGVFIVEFGWQCGAIRGYEPYQRAIGIRGEAEFKPLMLCQGAQLYIHHRALTVGNYRMRALSGRLIFRFTMVPRIEYVSRRHWLTTTQKFKCKLNIL